jgi:hypothetical protein
MNCFIFLSKVAMPRSLKGHRRVLSAEASLREYLEENVAVTPPESLQQRTREGTISKNL